MKIVVAPNAFKGGLTAAEAAEAMALGLRTVDPALEIVCLPIADGGDGLFDVFRSLFPGEQIDIRVAGPLSGAVPASYLHVPASRLAIIEMARASGLALLSPECRNPRKTTTRGVGELALDAIGRGAGRVVIGLGGSATNDGGIGFANALGVRFLDSGGRELAPVGESLPAIAAIDMSGLKEGVSRVTFEAICDVVNPLCGPGGAAAIYGPQKGATPEDVIFLDGGLENLARVVRNGLGLDLRDMPGAGAAGGLGFGLAAFTRARLRPGVEVILDLAGMDSSLEGADLVLTAEGMLDSQSAFGKGPIGVAKRAKRFGVPCLALAGGVAEDITNLHELGLSAAFSICRRPMSLQDAMENGKTLLAAATAQAFRAFLAGHSSAALAYRSRHAVEFGDT